MSKIKKKKSNIQNDVTTKDYGTVFPLPPEGIEEELKLPLHSKWYVYNYKKIF